MQFCEPMLLIVHGLFYMGLQVQAAISSSVENACNTTSQQGSPHDVVGPANGHSSTHESSPFSLPQHDANPRQSSSQGTSSTGRSTQLESLPAAALSTAAAPVIKTEEVVGGNGPKPPSQKKPGSARSSPRQASSAGSPTKGGSPGRASPQPGQQNTTGGAKSSRASPTRNALPPVRMSRLSNGSRATTASGVVVDEVLGGENALNVVRRASHTSGMSNNHAWGPAPVVPKRQNLPPLPSSGSPTFAGSGAAAGSYVQAHRQLPSIPPQPSNNIPAAPGGGSRSSRGSRRPTEEEIHSAAAVAAAAVLRSADQYAAPPTEASFQSSQGDIEDQTPMDLLELSASLPPSNFCSRTTSRMTDVQEVLDHKEQLLAGLDPRMAAEVMQGLLSFEKSGSSVNGLSAKLPPAASSSGMARANVKAVKGAR